MSGLLIGYARVSTDAQDLTAQRDGLRALGVEPERVYVDHGLTGTRRDRPGLREALAACRAGDPLVVTKLDRLARSLPDARDIVDDLTCREVKLNLGGSVHDPTDPVGRLLFNVFAMVAKAKGRLRGKQPKLTPAQEAHLVDLHRAGRYTSELNAAVGRAAAPPDAQLAALIAVSALTRSPYYLRHANLRGLARDGAILVGPCGGVLAVPPERRRFLATWQHERERQANGQAIPREHSGRAPSATRQTRSRTRRRRGGIRQTRPAFVKERVRAPRCGYARFGRRAGAQHETSPSPDTAVRFEGY